MSSSFTAQLGEHVIVTGASGFIGRHLCRALLEAGHEVHALCRTVPALSSPHLHWYSVDLADPNAVKNVFRTFENSSIFHLSSHAQASRGIDLVAPTFQNELSATVNLLTCAAQTGCKRVITAGSLEEPEAGDPPSSPYAAAKAASRLYARLFHHLYEVPVVMTRIFMAYGPGQSTKKIITHCITSILDGHPLTIKSPKRQVDWIYIDDVVDALLTVASTPNIEGRSIDIGSGTLVELGNVVDRICRLIDPTARVGFVQSESNSHEEVRRADMPATQSLVGWIPRISLDDGLEKTVQFHRQIRSTRH